VKKFQWNGMETDLRCGSFLKEEKIKKSREKGVDKRGFRMYYMQAASRETQKHRISQSNILKRFKNKSKKVLDKKERMC